MNAAWAVTANAADPFQPWKLPGMSLKGSKILDPTAFTFL
jgi:hypothetical protein